MSCHGAFAWLALRLDGDRLIAIVVVLLLLLCRSINGASPRRRLFPRFTGESSANDIASHATHCDTHGALCRFLDRAGGFDRRQQPSWTAKLARVPGQSLDFAI